MIFNIKYQCIHFALKSEPFIHALNISNHNHTSSHSEHMPNHLHNDIYLQCAACTFIHCERHNGLNFFPKIKY